MKIRMEQNWPEVDRGGEGNGRQEHFEGGGAERRREWRTWRPEGARDGEREGEGGGRRRQGGRKGRRAGGREGTGRQKEREREREKSVRTKFVACPELHVYSGMYPQIAKTS